MGMHVMFTYFFNIWNTYREMGQDGKLILTCLFVNNAVDSYIPTKCIMIV